MRGVIKQPYLEIEPDGQGRFDVYFCRPRRSAKDQETVTERVWWAALRCDAHAEMFVDLFPQYKG